MDIQNITKFDGDPWIPANVGYTWVAYVVGSIDILVFFVALAQVIRIYTNEIEVERALQQNTNVCLIFIFFIFKTF